MDKLGLLLSKKVLVILSGVMFTGIAFASSGAQSLIQNIVFASSEAKIPEVQKVTSTDVSPSPVPVQAVQNNKPALPVVVKTPIPIPTQSPIAVLPKPTARVTPRPSSAPVVSNATPALRLSSTTQATITGLGEDRHSREEEEDSEDRRTGEDDSTESEISKAFQRARDDD